MSRQAYTQHAGMYIDTYVGMCVDMYADMYEDTYVDRYGCIQICELAPVYSVGMRVHVCPDG